MIEAVAGWGNYIIGVLSTTLAALIIWFFKKVFSEAHKTYAGYYTHEKWIEDREIQCGEHAENLKLIKCDIEKIKISISNIDGYLSGKFDKELK